MGMNYVFVDAETDGLYGEFITVAMACTDETGAILDKIYIGVKRENINIKSEWVRENVLPILGKYEEVNDETNLLEAAWAFWDKYREKALCIADVPYPVETRLFERCVKLNLEEREMKAPFPLLDLSSMLYAKGIDPLISREEFNDDESEMKHNAMYDVMEMIKIWKKIL